MPEVHRQFSVSIQVKVIHVVNPEIGGRARTDEVASEHGGKRRRIPGAADVVLLGRRLADAVFCARVRADSGASLVDRDKEEVESAGAVQTPLDVVQICAARIFIRSPDRIPAMQ